MTLHLHYPATLNRATAEERLDRLLIPGPLHDDDLDRRIERLSRAFRRYAASYPLPVWAPHLVLDNEMRARTEALFPVAEVRSAFRTVLARGCRFRPLLEVTPLHSAPTWLDLLQGMHPWLAAADPAPALQLLAASGTARRAFLFALFLPQHYGPSFERYPRQAEWLAAWLASQRARLHGRVRALDCACGSGEGTYRLAEIIRACGYQGGGSSVEGATFEPIELFAAAHARLYHDPRREATYRARVEPLLSDGDAPRVAFRLEEAAAAAQGGYQVILCNGLLGGPMLAEREQVGHAIRALARRLAPGGVLLAADRFHAGWKKRLPPEALGALLAAAGLQAVTVPEGIGGRKS